MSVAGIFRPEDFGAQGNGETDDTTPLQTAIDIAATMGGIVQLSQRKYVITQPLHTRQGKFTLRGNGWHTNVSELYDTAGDQYDGYHTSILDTTPTFHVSGSVIYAKDCHGFIRDSREHSHFRAEGFALVGSGTSPKTAFCFGDYSIYDRATSCNLYRDIGAFHWEVAFDCSMQYYANYYACTARGCKEGVRLGNPNDGLHGSGGGANNFYGVDLQSNDQCVAIYEGIRLTISGGIAQGHKNLIYIRPNGNNSISGVTVRDVYLESQFVPNHILVLAESATNPGPQAAQQVSLERINVQGANAIAFDFGSGKASISHLCLDGIKDDQSQIITIPPHITPVQIRACRFGSATLTVDSPHAIIVGTEAVNGSSYAGFSVVNINNQPSTQAVSLPSPTSVGSLHYTGIVEILGTSRSASVTFSTPELDANYHVICGVESFEGNPPSGAFILKGCTNISTTGFTANIASAPGASAKVRYRWVLIR